MNGFVHQNDVALCSAEPKPQKPKILVRLQLAPGADVSDMMVGDPPRTPPGARIADVPDEILHVRISATMHHLSFFRKEWESLRLYLDLFRLDCCFGLVCELDLGSKQLYLRYPDGLPPGYVHQNINFTPPVVTMLLQSLGLRKVDTHLCPSHVLRLLPCPCVCDTTAARSTAGYFAEYGEWKFTEAPTQTSDGIKAFPGRRGRTSGDR